MDFAGRAVAPGKIVCVGRNYRAHVAELGNVVPAEPVLFLKPNSAITRSPAVSPVHAVHYEAEITLLMAQGRIAGVGLGLDLTRRDLQRELARQGLPWERAKAFDGAAAFSRFVPLDVDPNGLHLSLDVNGEQVQAGGCDRMVFPPQKLLKAIARDFTLIDGDLVMTGTPAGVGQLAPGDRLVGKIFHGDHLMIEQTWTIVAGD